MNTTDRVIRKSFIEHVRELRWRLFICVAFIVIGGAVGYAIRGSLLELIQRPINQILYYTTPTGGFSFVFKLCIFFGLVIALPVIVYHVIKFIEPAVTKSSNRHFALAVLWSLVLAAAGISFAYIISLPAALHFLANFGEGNIESLINAEAYFNFAIAYLVGFALLFQLPLIILFINRVKPLKPKKMMSAQRFVLLGSFLIAAILTPTPDPVNQLLMAAPAVVLYQISIVLVMIINHYRRKRMPAQFLPVSRQFAPQPIAVQPAANKSFTPYRTARPQRPRRLVSDFVMVAQQPQDTDSQQIKPSAELQRDYLLPKRIAGSVPRHALYQG